MSNMKTLVLINEIDVSDYLLSWKINYRYADSINSGQLKLRSTVTSLLSLEGGLNVKIYRGFETPDVLILDSVITKINTHLTEINLVLKDRLIDAMKTTNTKSWDWDMDPEGGKGSEIFKSIATNAGFEYDENSIDDTGDLPIQKIKKFIQNEEDDYKKMKELADIYQYNVFLDYETGLINFKKKNFINYPAALSVGIDIPAQLNWNENMENMINHLKIIGASAFDTVFETFTGPASEFILSKTPEDTEVRINHSTSNDLQTRGQVGVGTVGVNYDYFIDKQNKTLNFDSDVSDVWIRYTRQIPLPVIVKNETSIIKYGGINKKPYKKTMFFNDLTNIDDAIKRGNEIIKKYSVPFITLEDVPILDSVIEENGFIKPGFLIEVIDSNKDRTSTLAVREVEMNWPHIYDIVNFGDKIWRTESWQVDQIQKLNQLFNQLNKNQDILNIISEFDRNINFNRRYFKVLKSADSVNYDEIIIIQGRKIFEELFYDEDFFDEDLSDAEVHINSVERVLVIPEGKTFYTKSIEKNTSRTSFFMSVGDITNTEDVSLKYEITYNNTNWTEFNINTLNNFPEPSTDIRLRITNEG